MQRKWVVSPEYRSAIEVIATARQSLGLSQRELARRLGKHPSFVNKIELLERRLDILEFIAVARAMQIDPTALVGSVASALPTHFEL